MAGLLDTEVIQRQENSLLPDDEVIDAMSVEDLQRMQDLLAELQAKVAAKIVEKTTVAAEPETASVQPAIAAGSEVGPRSEQAQQAFEKFLEVQVATAVYSDIRTAIDAFVKAYPQGTPDGKYTQTSIQYLSKFGLMDTAILFNENSQAARNNQLDKLTQISEALGARVSEIQSTCQAFVKASRLDRTVPDRFIQIEKAFDGIILVLGKQVTVGERTIKEKILDLSSLRDDFGAADQYRGNAIISRLSNNLQGL